MDDRTALEITGLTKTYGDGSRALDGVSLRIGKGLFGLLGPNGAGKSTLMRTIATLQDPDSGSITFAGRDVLADSAFLRARLGYLPQEFGVYPGVPAVRLLDYLALLKGITDAARRREQIERLLRLTNLWDDRKRAVSDFSGGMKQRFGIAQALLGEPELVIVDEPTAGLDPQERHRFNNLLSEIGQEVVVILSTHIVEDVAQLCSSLAVIDRGRVRLQGRPAEVVEALAGRVWQTTVGPGEIDALRAENRVLSSILVAGRTRVHVLSEGSPGEGFEPVTPSLEDVYFSVLDTAGADERERVEAA